MIRNAVPLIHETLLKNLKLEDMRQLISDVAMLGPCSEPAAVVTVGTYMHMTGIKPDTAKQVMLFVNMIKSKRIPDLVQPEIDMLLELGYLRPKQSPLKSTRVGRNDKCPCGSGIKYKRCCENKTGTLEEDHGRENEERDKDRNRRDCGNIDNTEHETD
jgi:hypothetical protein